MERQSRKQEIISSRELLTEALSEALASLKAKPSVLMSGSAIGYYGPTGSDHATEESPAGSDFLAEVATRWGAGYITSKRGGYKDRKHAFRYRS